MRVDLFDFDLPEDHIALRPAEPRDAARLLVVRAGGALEHRYVRDLPDLLRAGDALLLNDTKVLPARLSGRRLARDETGAGAAIETTLHKRSSPNSFRGFVRPAKRLRAGDEILFGKTLRAHVASREEGEAEFVFERAGADLDAAIAREGDMPLPPYIASRRSPDNQDRTDYQTVYADEPGSIAAPTASLHFTPELLERLVALGVKEARLTLHVGPGTFLPVTADDTAAHKMHPEWATLSQTTAGTLNASRAAGGRIVAAGTTALRTLESAADEEGRIHPFAGETALFITPGYRFKAADVLLTNFHLPRSTLFMLVAAFAGLDVMKNAYARAIKEGYRFYSYGDACLLFRN